MKTNRSLVSILMVVFASVSFKAQFKQYSYTNELLGVSDTWHYITLPDDIISKVAPSFNDIRIYGVTSTNDTIEVPYIVNESKDRVEVREQSFDKINFSSNDKGWYYTFKLKKKEPINEIKLQFGKENFDWNVTLEGSQDLNNWFTIVKDYRIISLQNERTNYSFTTLNFLNSTYNYYRLFIPAKENPDLLSVDLDEVYTSKGKYREYKNIPFTIQENRDKKQTIVFASLPTRVPINEIKLEFKEDVDFYRPAQLYYLKDSFKMKEQWRYNYNYLSSGTFSSMEDDIFLFSSTSLKKIKIEIDNDDNRPLQLLNISAKGNSYTLIARFTEPAKYYITYGNKGASAPEYDIENFTDKIPSEMGSLQLGPTINKEQINKEKEPASFFSKKIWLWIVLLLLILVLGGFTLKMMNNVEG